MFMYHCNTSGSLKVRNITLDTTAHPLVANLGGGTNLTIENTNGASSDMPLVSGLAWGNYSVRAYQGLQSEVGQNINMTGTNNGASYQNQNLVVAPINKILTTNASIPGAPTCSTATAGPPYTQVFPSSTFTYFPVYPGGGLGTQSAVGNACSADGTTQQVTLTIPSAIPGAIGYSVWLGTAQFGTVSSGCVNPGMTGLSAILASGCGVSAPQVQTGGPAQMYGTTISAHTPLVTGWQDFLQQSSAPANPPAGTCRNYFDAISGQMKGQQFLGSFLRSEWWWRDGKQCLAILRSLLLSGRDQQSTEWRCCSDHQWLLEKRLQRHGRCCRSPSFLSGRLRESRHHRSYCQRPRNLRRQRYGHCPRCRLLTPQ